MMKEKTFVKFKKKIKTSIKFHYHKAGFFSTNNDATDNSVEKSKKVTYKFSFGMIL